MITKGNDSKIQNEVMAQIVADNSAKWMKFTRLIPKQEIEEDSQYYTYMTQRVNIEDAIAKGQLGEVKDVAHNVIGKPLDNMVNGVENFYNAVSVQARERAAFVNDLRERADNVRDFGGLADIIRIAGENEDKMKGNEASYQIHRATGKYLEQLDDQVNTNTKNIARNAEKIAIHEE